MNHKVFMKDFLILFQLLIDYVRKTKLCKTFTYVKLRLS